MSEAYDAVVVGSGLGGLAAGARLAREGARVLVVERHEQLGGYASTFSRPPFTFEVSLHLLDAALPGEPNRAILEDLGVASQLDLVRPRELRRERWPDLDVVVPYGRDAYLEALGRIFPPERAGLSSLFAIARAAHDAFQEGRGDALSPLSPIGRATAGAVIDAHVSDRRLRAMLALFGRAWLGSPLDELAALQFLVPWYSYHRYGGAYPRGGSAAIVSALAGVIERAGGALAVSTAATRIHVERRRVVGVSLSDGRRASTRVVISNASPQSTLGLIDDEDAQWRARIGRLVPSVACIKVWLGLAPAADDDGRDYDLYLCDSYDLGEPGPQAGALSITTPHLLVGGPPVVALTRLVAAGSSVRREDAEALIERAALELPALRDRIQVREIATPATFERFTSNPRGSIYGARATVDQCGARRLPRETPFEGLWLAGAWTRPGAGFSSVLRSGRDAAVDALRRMRRA